jgi:hypothetical protein
MFSLVDRVGITLPHAHVIVVSTYLGWISAFISSILLQQKTLVANANEAPSNTIDYYTPKRSPLTASSANPAEDRTCHRAVTSNPIEPTGERWIGPNGDEALDFHPGTPGSPKWGGRDHWHLLRLKNGKWVRDPCAENHLKPGDIVDVEEPDVSGFDRWLANRSDAELVGASIAGGVIGAGVGYGVYAAAGGAAALAGAWEATTGVLARAAPVAARLVTQFAH